MRDWGRKGGEQAWRRGETYPRRRHSETLDVDWNDNLDGLESFVQQFGKDFDFHIVFLFLFLFLFVHYLFDFHIVCFLSVFVYVFGFCLL